ncbi:MAG: VanW family protein [Patescibacteria group bacterium]|nr:VanW family protein [Patescibacteria group bacterium]
MRSNMCRWGLIILTVFLVLASGLVSIYHLAYNNKIYPRVRINSLELSNLSLEAAESKLTQLVPENLGKIKLRFGNQEWLLNLAELNIRYEPKLTAQKIFLRGRSQGFWQDLKLKWHQWQKEAVLKMEVELDQEKLAEMMEMMMTGIVEEPILPTLSLNKVGKVDLEPGKNGRLVEKDQLMQALVEKIRSLDFSTVEIPVKLVKIEISAGDLIKAQDRAEKLKDKSIILKQENFSRIVAKDELINLIGFSSDWDEQKIATLSASLAISLNREAQNAIFQFDGQKVVAFKPALNGMKVDEEMTNLLIKKGLENLDSAENIEETILLAIQITQPKIGNEQVNDLGIKELIGKGESTFFHSIPGRIHNVALTAAKLNGVLVAPGEEFSFNRALGDVSAATGFKPAYIIKNGRTVLGDGGGVCQDSTTLFRALLDAGVNITERHAHAYRVTYYEQNEKPGFDATVYSPSVDLKFINDTPGYILIQATVDIANFYLKFELYGTSDGREVTISNVRLWGQAPPPEPLYQDDPTLAPGQIKQVDWAAWGAKTAFDWRVVKNKEVLQQKTFYSNYTPWRAIYLKGI